jgi:membrane-bound serine protease (ClpP class)
MDVGLSPGLAFTLGITGTLGVYCEFVRPGKVWPGAIGSMLLVVSAYSLAQYHPSMRGLILLASAAVLFLVETFQETRLISGIAGTVALAAGSSTLLDKPRTIPPVLACLLSLILGSVTVYLANGAKRARRNKRIDLTR